MVITFPWMPLLSGMLLIALVGWAGWYTHNAWILGFALVWVLLALGVVLTAKRLAVQCAEQIAAAVQGERREDPAVQDPRTGRRTTGCS